jgi:hypothetical protein
MLSTGVLLAAAVLAPSGPASSAPLALQGKAFHEDTRFGFKVRPPKGWKQIPLKVDEQWLVAKYLSDKAYFYIDPDTKWDYEHRPEMLVIAFVEQPEREEEEVEVTEEGDTTTVEIKENPYKDYEDFLDKTYTGGGFYVAAREDLTVNGIAVTRTEIKVEKLATTGPKHIETWIYHLEGVDVAVQFEVLQNSWKKLKSTVKKSHKSVKTIPRAEGASPLDQSRTLGWITIGEMDEGDAAQRRKTRMEAELLYREKVLASLPDDWSAKQVGRCFVVSHVDDKYGKRVAAQATAVLNWLDKNMSFIGPDEYVRGPVLRICADQEEEWSFRKGGDGWFTTGIEIVTHKQAGSFDNFEWEWMNRQLYDLWFRDRDRDLYWALPSWIDRGLADVFENSRAKGKKLEFHADQWDRDELRNEARAGNSTRPRDLMRMIDSEYNQGDSWNRTREASALVRYLLTGKASRSPKTKTLLRDYLLNLQQVVAEIEAEEAAAADDDAETKRPQTEEEEEEMHKARRSSWEAAERRLIDAAWQRTFGSWSNSDWESFEKGYYKEIG